MVSKAPIYNWPFRRSLKPRTLFDCVLAKYWLSIVFRRREPTTRVLPRIAAASKPNAFCDWAECYPNMLLHEAKRRGKTSFNGNSVTYFVCLFACSNLTKSTPKCTLTVQSQEVRTNYPGVALTDPKNASYRKPTGLSPGKSAYRCACGNMWRHLSDSRSGLLDCRHKSLWQIAQRDQAKERRFA